MLPEATKLIQEAYATLNVAIYRVVKKYGDERDLIAVKDTIRCLEKVLGIPNSFPNDK